MEIDITYDGQRYRFNLSNELQINERRLNPEVKSHASSYSFLTQLHNAVILQCELLEEEKDNTYARLYIRYKETKSDLTGRPLSDDLCKQKAIAHKDHRRAMQQWITMKHHKNSLDKAVKAFETRGFLIQTLSANVRKEQ